MRVIFNQWWCFCLSSATKWRSPEDLVSWQEKFGASGSWDTTAHRTKFASYSGHSPRAWSAVATSHPNSLSAECWLLGLVSDLTWLDLSVTLYDSWLLGLSVISHDCLDLSVTLYDCLDLSVTLYGCWLLRRVSDFAWLDLSVTLYDCWLLGLVRDFVWLLVV